jgi:hypothetical protein
LMIGALVQTTALAALAINMFRRRSFKQLLNDA